MYITSHTAVIVLAAVGALLTAHASSAPAPDNSATSIDWDGSYSGVVPCADCEGIETMIQLNKDRTYLIRTKYLGKDGSVREQRGTFAWNSNGTVIHLQGIGHAHQRYFLVGENTLTPLDAYGNRITGDSAGRYVLRKAVDAAPADALFAPTTWKLTELRDKPVTEASDTSKSPSLTFEREGSRAYGFGGCNRFTGTFEFAPGNRLRFSKVAITDMACVDMTVETEFMKVLATVDSYYLDGQMLILNRARMAPLARFEAVK